MRMAALGVLLVLSTSTFAEPEPVIARHRPMHPVGVPVTFEATAVADRIILSYQRSTLSTAPDGTHVQSTVESAIITTCDSQRPGTSVTCAFTMPAPFPAGSLITFSAIASNKDNSGSVETYSFAAGEFPWPNDPIPIRLKGDTKSKLDTVFIPAGAIEVSEFADQLDEVLELYFKYDPIRQWRGMHNFWYSGQKGDYKEFCKFTDPPNMAELRVVADAIAYLHKEVLRDCSNIPRMSSEIDDEKSIVHENSHTLYGLQDEYCCNTKYKPQECAPNIYGSLADCEADAENLGYPKSNCIRLEYETTIKDVWRIDPSTEPACIMGPNQNKKSSLFRSACLRRLRWRYQKCRNGECFPSSACP